MTENTFATGGRVDMSGPVIRLAALTPEDLYVLLTKLVHVYAAGNPDAHLLPDEALEAFMTHCSSKIGEAYFRTPRNTIRSFLDLLAVLEQNTEQKWDQIIDAVPVQRESNPDLEPLEDPEREPDFGPAAPITPGPAVQVGIAGNSPSVPGPVDEDDDDLHSFRL